MTKSIYETKSFYNQYWPHNFPDYLRTKEHVLKLLPKKSYAYILDGGCGSGVCSLALSSIAERVISLDISRDAMLSGKEKSESLKFKNIFFIEGSLLELPFSDKSFDLVFSWGAIHHTPDPIRALDELVRVLKSNGTVIIAVYLKTKFTWLHELIRKICLKFSSIKLYKILFIKFFSLLIKCYDSLAKTQIQRNDNIYIDSLVEDWFFVPEKHFFKIEQMKDIFRNKNLDFELLYEQVGRFKSSTNFIVRGIKR